MSTFRSRSADRGLKCHPGTISELCSGSLHESLARDGTRSTALYIHVYFPAHACNGESRVPLRAKKVGSVKPQGTRRCNPQNALERRSIALNELRHRIQCIAAVGLRSSIVLAGYLPAGIAIASDMRSSATGRADGPSSSSLASQATLSAGSVASTSRQSPGRTRITSPPPHVALKPVHVLLELREAGRRVWLRQMNCGATRAYASLIRSEPSVYNILGRTSHADSFTGIDALVFVSTEW